MVESGGVAIRALEEGSGVRVIDQIDRRGVDLQTPRRVDPEPTTTEPFPYTVELAIEISSSSLRITRSPAIHIYDPTGEPIDDISFGETRELGKGTFFVLLETNLVIYLKVEGPATIDVGPRCTEVTLGRSRPLQIGLRRVLDGPAGTITTTRDPEDILTALSYLGGAIQTYTPRRSYPSLRGHPPRIELGDTLSVPDLVTLPASKIRVEIPPNLAAAYVAAPLAYYLPAELVPGESARIVTDAGFVHEMEDKFDFETEVERILKQTLFLDCITRDTITAKPTVEQEILTENISFDIESIGKLSPHERLKQYLETPFEAIEEYIPRWKLVAHVQPTPEYVEVLPYLTNDLAIVKSPADHASSEPKVPSAVSGFFRSGAESTVRSRDESTLSSSPTKYVQVTETSAVEQAWVGEGVPLGATKAVPKAFENLTQREENEANLRLAVVCNDENMLQEGAEVVDVYGAREELQFEIEIFKHLTKSELRNVLTGSVDFLHYVGHIDQDGFECTDGALDAATLEDIGVESFVLNACHSYRQGLALIEAGAIGGVVTLDAVINSGAIRVGKMIARLLNRGFPLRPALMIARNRSVYGLQYLVVGDGNFDIATNHGLVPVLTEVRSCEEGFDIGIETYPTRVIGMGSVFQPYLSQGTDEWYMASSQLSEFHVDEKELRTYLERHVHPVIFDGELTWSDRIDLEE